MASPNDPAYLRTRSLSDLILRPVMRITTYVIQFLAEVSGTQLRQVLQVTASSLVEADTPLRACRSAVWPVHTDGACSTWTSPQSKGCQRRVGVHCGRPRVYVTQKASAA